MVVYICKFSMIALFISPIYLLLRRPWRHWDKREAALTVFILFTVALLALAFEGTYSTPSAMIENMRHRITSGERINLVPFRTISTFLRHFMPDIFLVNIVGNIVMFMPWGFGIVLLWKKNRTVRRVLFLCFLITALIEAGQLFINRSVDVDDLILNFIGGCAGAALCAGIKRKFPVLEEFAK
ncbi:MAG: VanZ family protein [Lachnospiraceae bacterium]|nr:VanZ family protein [Lachnospiraceae bacterium]